MAKQSGLHQIRGKIGEHSYYRQTGVSSGLIRQINPGLSERVKTAPEYENTRLNSAEFKIATQAAGSLFEGIQPILRPTKALFRTSKLAADLYKILQYVSGDWGSRIFSANNRDNICAAVNKFQKRNFADYASIEFGSYDSTNHKLPVTITPQSDVDAYMAAMGADGIKFIGYQMQFYEGIPAGVGEYFAENLVVLQEQVISQIDYKIWPEYSPYTMNIDCKGPDLNVLSGRVHLSFIVVVALPIRGNAEPASILQSNCTFAIFPDPEHNS